MAGHVRHPRCSGGGVLRRSAARRWGRHLGGWGGGPGGGDEVGGEKEVDGGGEGLQVDCFGEQRACRGLSGSIPGPARRRTRRLSAEVGTESRAAVGSRCSGGGGSGDWALQDVSGATPSKKTRI